MGTLRIKERPEGRLIVLKEPGSGPFKGAEVGIPRLTVLVVSAACGDSVDSLEHEVPAAARKHTVTAPSTARSDLAFILVFPSAMRPISAYNGHHNLAGRGDFPVQPRGHYPSR